MGADAAPGWADGAAGPLLSCFCWWWWWPVEADTKVQMKGRYMRADTSWRTQQRLLGLLTHP